jgi:hypothetical protein
LLAVNQDSRAVYPSSVGPACRFHPILYRLVGRIPFENSVVGLVGEVDTPVDFSIAVHGVE